MSNTQQIAARTNDINNLQAEMDRMIESVGNNGLSTGQFKQGEWYQDRKAQLQAMLDRQN